MFHVRAVLGSFSSSHLVEHPFSEYYKRGACWHLSIAEVECSAHVETGVLVKYISSKKGRSFRVLGRMKESISGDETRETRRVWRRLKTPRTPRRRYTPARSMALSKTPQPSHRVSLLSFPTTAEAVSPSSRPKSRGDAKGGPPCVRHSWPPCCRAVLPLDAFASFVAR